MQRPKWYITQVSNPDTPEAKQLLYRQQLWYTNVIIFKEGGIRNFSNYSFEELYNEFNKIEWALQEKQLEGKPLMHAELELQNIKVLLQVFIPRNPIKELGFQYKHGSGKVEKDISDYNLTTKQ
jgi:hypothetical protein